jgi:hypothetical protein
MIYIGMYGMNFILCMYVAVSSSLLNVEDDHITLVLGLCTWYMETDNVVFQANT